MKAHILIVEDNDSDQSTMAFLLKKTGYKVSTASDGYAAIDFLSNRPADDLPVSLIIMDLQMPRLSGITTLKKIKEIPSVAHIPFMVVSGKKDKDSVQDAIKIGAKDYMVKPIDHEIFLKKISQLTANIKSDWAEVSVPDSPDSHGYFHAPARVISINEVTCTVLSRQMLTTGSTTTLCVPMFTEFELKDMQVRVLDSKKTDAGYVIQFEILGLSNTQMTQLRLYARKIYAETKT